MARVYQIDFLPPHALHGWLLFANPPGAGVPLSFVRMHAMRTLGPFEALLVNLDTRHAAIKVL